MEPVSSRENDLTLNSEQLDAYLAKLSIDRPVELDFDYLAQLHRAHLMTFTWEAIDAFMGWPSAFEPTAAFTKMVAGRRGGWCFEMNGLFGAALTGLGYKVTRLCGCVDRPHLGELAIGNHLTLQIELDRHYLAEVGVADAFIDPVPLMSGAFTQRGFDFSIVEAEDGWLRLNNHAYGVARTVDFKPGYNDEARNAAMQSWLMKDPASPFTGALAAFRHVPDGYVSLQNDRLRWVSAAGVDEQRITTAGQLADLFQTVFDIDVPQVEEVWNRVCTVVRAQAA